MSLRGDISQFDKMGKEEGFFIRFVLLLGIAFLLTACTHEGTQKEIEGRSMSEAFYEQNDKGNLIYTKALNDETGIAMFEIENGYGIRHLEKGEKGWRSSGGASFSLREAPPTEGVSFSSAATVLGTLDFGSEPTYQTTFFGRIYSSEINSIQISYGEYQEEAVIVESEGKRYYYLVAKGNDVELKEHQLKGFSTEGEVVYEQDLG